MSIFEGLSRKIKDKSSVVGIIGLGYVGLPLVQRFLDCGFKIIGFDIDGEKIEKLLRGESYIKHIEFSALKSAIAQEKFLPTTNFKHATECDALVICVPTPLNDYREPDLSYVTGTMDSIAPHLRKGQLISLESTTYPGTTDEELLPRIEKRGFKVGEDVFLVFSPEREDPGNPQFSTRQIPKVVGGVTPQCLRLGVELYQSVIDRIIPVSSTKVAEMTKLLENIYRCVNIGLVNELKLVTDRMGINLWEVIEAASSKPFGFTPFYPGPGLGGHCIPIDPFYLTWKAREYGVHTRFIELAGEVNTSMPHWVLGKVADALNDRAKSIKNSKILVVGLAYKKNVDDIRESPAVELMSLLSEKGALISYSDPYIPAFPRMRRYKFNLESVKLTPESIARFDCVLIATNHDAYDYDLLRKHAQLIVDTRGCYKNEASNVVRA